MHVILQYLSFCSLCSVQVPLAEPDPAHLLAYPPDASVTPFEEPPGTPVGHGSRESPF
jgi:hypothetical protein